MPLHITIEQTADVAVLQCAGRIVRGRAVHFLHQAVTSLKPARIIVLDVSRVKTIDGGGLGELVFLYRWARGNAIQLKLVNPSNFVRTMLERTGLTRVMCISAVDDVVEILCMPKSTTGNANWVAGY
jgi:anti-anti-sigma factor